MRTNIKQSADGIVVRIDNKLDATQRKVFINNHEITDIDTFFKVAEENTRLLEQVKKQKEVIDKAVKYIDDLRDESAERQEFYNCFPDDLYIPDINELLGILKDKEV